MARHDVLQAISLGMQGLIKRGGDVSIDRGGRSILAGLHLCQCLLGK